MCSHCADCHRTRAVHMVSVDMSGSAQGRWRRVRVPQPVKNEDQSLSGTRACPRSSARALAVQLLERLRHTCAAHV